MLSIAELGMTQEELQDRVVKAIADKVMSTVGVGEEGEEYAMSTSLKRKLDEAARKQIDEAINQLAQTHVLPNVTDYIEKFTIQKTNEWGEKKGQSITFIEYLAQRAQEYMSEKVSFDGKSKSESGSYSFDGKQTRITYLIDKHLQYSIQNFTQTALADANANIVKGITETIKIKLAEVQESIKVGVSMKK